MFYPIHNFNNIYDYLAILNGSLVADIIIIFMLYYTKLFNSKFLKNWYESYRLSAVLADVLILMIGIILARLVFKYFNWSWNIYKFIVIVLIIQIIHDILFYILFTSIPRGTNNMIDLFKDYSKEVGIGAIVGDSFMMLIATLLASYFNSLSLNSNIILLISSCYLLPYILYTR